MSSVASLHRESKCHRKGGKLNGDALTLILRVIRQRFSESRWTNQQDLSDREIRPPNSSPKNPGPKKFLPPPSPVFTPCPNRHPTQKKSLVSMGSAEPTV